MRYAPALDGLRAVAVLAVVAYHCGWFPLGYRGVDVFFVLSGFLITRLLVAEYAQYGAVSLQSFYARRALRLLPALASVLVVVGSVMLVRQPSWKTIAYLVGVGSYVGNYVLTWFGVGRPLDHFWSLAVEEQFYLVWPLFLLGVLRLPRIWIRCGLVGLVGLLAFHRLGAPAELLAGGAIAFLPMPSWLVLLGRPFVAAPLTWIGRRSYGIYLWHFPILYALGDPWHERYPVGTALLGVAITILLAAVSFRFVEQPALALKTRLPRWIPRSIGFAWLVPVGIALATALLYLPTLRFGWIGTYDDQAMLLNNANLLGWDFRWAFRSLFFGHWMPLTWITWTVDAHLWGVWAGGWHIVNFGLHATNAALLYLIAYRLLRSRPGAAFASAFWALHPLRLESVAWISERKDVLSGVFFFLALLAYLKYTDKTTRLTSQSETRVYEPSVTWWYALSLLAFLAACASKSIAVVFVPFVLLLDWAVLHRRTWREKLPFVAIATAISVVAFIGIHSAIHNLLPWNKVGLGPRLLHVAYSFVFYARQTVWPSRMSHMIEYTWAPSLGQIEYPIAVVLVLGVVAAVVALRSRVVTAAIMAYAVAVLPQAGLFQNGPQLVANRYSYLATLPLILLVAGGLQWLIGRWPRIGMAAGATTVAAYTLATFFYLPIWTNDATLQTYAAESEPTCLGCQQWAAIVAVRQGDVQAARRDLERGLAIPDVPDWMRHEQLWGYGAVLDYLGDRERARLVLRAYLASQPAEVRAYPYEQAHMQDAEARLARLEHLR